MQLLWNSLAIILLVIIAHAQSTPLVAIYGMREKSALEAVITEYEAILRVHPNDPQALKALGVAYHNLGVQKTSGAVAKAVKYLQQANTRLPADAEVLVHLGSARTMVARDSWNPFTKLNAVRKGTKLIDTAVRREPDNVTVRLVRANNSLKLPGFLKRVHHAKRDLQHLLELSSSEGREVSTFSPEMMAEIHFKLGEIYRDENEEELAKHHWTKAVAIAPNSKWGREAKRRL